MFQDSPLAWTILAWILQFTKHSCFFEQCNECEGTCFLQRSIQGSKESMKEEFNALETNETWETTDLLARKNAIINSKWVYMT